MTEELDERNDELQELKKQVERIVDRNTRDKCEMYLRKMARNINNNPNYKIYEKQLKSLIRADQTVRGE